MIFDLTRRVSGGGSGPSASDAILTVTVPTGSTVTATKGGVTLTPTMWVQAADPTLDCALFVIASSLFDSQNAWTVTATLGSKVGTENVIIDTNKQFDLAIDAIVPEGYQAVEYIQDSGSAYINTWISLPGDNFEIYLKAQRVQSSSGEMYLASTFGGAYVYFDIQLRSNELDFYFNGHHVDGASAITGLPFEAFLSRSGSTWSYHINTNPVKTGTYATTGNTNNVQFFRSNTVKGTAGNRIMRCTIKESGVIVGDYIPCYRKSDSVPGMWDDATDSFLTNSAGSGTFIVGPDV